MGVPGFHVFNAAALACLENSPGGGELQRQSSAPETVFEGGRFCFWKGEDGVWRRAGEAGGGGGEGEKKKKRASLAILRRKTIILESNIPPYLSSLSVAFVDGS